MGIHSNFIPAWIFSSNKLNNLNKSIHYYSHEVTNTSSLGGCRWFDNDILHPFASKFYDGSSKSPILSHQDYELILPHSLVQLWPMKLMSYMDIRFTCRDTSSTLWWKPPFSIMKFLDHICSYVIKGRNKHKHITCVVFFMKSTAHIIFVVTTTLATWLNPIYN